MVIIGRPYNSAAPGANLDVRKKFSELGVHSPAHGHAHNDNKVVDNDLVESMSGAMDKDVGTAAIRKIYPKHIQHIHLQVLQIRGPDSFSLFHFSEVSKGEPFLQLKIDEHGAVPEWLSRLEAFINGVKYKAKPCNHKKQTATILDKIPSENNLYT